MKLVDVVRDLQRILAEDADAVVHVEMLQAQGRRVRGTLQRLEVFRDEGITDIWLYAATIGAQRGRSVETEETT